LVSRSAKDGALFGLIMIYRQEVRPFSEWQIKLMQRFAAQAVIAMGNVWLITEQREAIDQQAATIDVLKAMSAAAGDTRPVFDLITLRARELCEALASMLYEFDGADLHLRSWDGYDTDAAQDYLRLFPGPPDRGTAAGRAILERCVIHIRNVGADPEISQAVRTMGVGSSLAIPQMPDKQPIGLIAIGLTVAGGFPTVRSRCCGPSPSRR
jgi:two-component system NtrC family sensor kinase